MKRKVYLVQIGVGSVGRAAGRLLLASRARWQQQYDVDVKYMALVDTRGAVVEQGGLSDTDVLNALAAKSRGDGLAEIPNGQQMNAQQVLDGLGRDSRNVVVVDCAAGDSTYGADVYALEMGWRLVLSNKAPLAVDQARYDRMVEVGGDRLWNEATVGAGLPVIGTLRSLLDTGDEVREITGCLSGTLGFITSELMAGRTYSEAVKRARELGYTEPDPRDDLSGLDVARKALILARMLGRKLNLEEIEVEPLLPASDSATVQDPSLPVEEFMEALQGADEEFAGRVTSARRSGNSLKYIARVPAEGPVTVGLVGVPADSQVGALTGPDNIVIFRTREYHDHPLMVIGPGAGPVNTAMGVLADVLMAARS